MTLGIFPPDGRTEVIDTTAFPFSAIGRMRMRWKGADGVLGTADDIEYTGSGAMIDSYHFLTAGHCVFHKKDNFYDDLGWADSIEIILGSKGNIISYGTTDRADYEYYGEANSVTMRSYEAWTKDKNFDYDLGLVTLDRNIGNFTSWFGYGYDDNLSSGTLLNVAGYPTDKFDSNGDRSPDNYDMWTQSGRITSTTDLTLRSTELDIISGNSGGPLWSYNSTTNERTIYGVVSNNTSGPQPGETYNEFTRITSSRYADIQRWISEDNAARRPVDKADLVDYDDWFDTHFASFSKTEVDPGDNLSLRAVVRNNGTATASSFAVSFYASRDADMSTWGDNYFIGKTTISSLNPFSFTDAIWEGALPAIARGSYYIGWYIDSEGTVSEFDESRNTGIIANSTIYIDPNNAPTDILIYDLQSTYAKGSTVSLSQIYAYDKDGYSDLAYLDFQLRKPDGTWINLQDAYGFVPWESDSRWGKTDYSFSLNGLGAGTYQLWATAYDRFGLSGNTFQRSFTIAPNTVYSATSRTLNPDDDNLTLTGTAAINGTGNALNNVITGNSAANILDGGTGDDTLIGGDGNDTYIVDSLGDVIIDTSGTGIETVRSSVSWTLGTGLDNLVLTGTAAINGTGNTINNKITGNSAANILDGGTGSDTLEGGYGDDIYIVDSAGDVIIESSGTGIETVRSSVSWTLGTGLDHLTLTGTAAIAGTGNALTNIIVGNSNNNVLNGGLGNDTLTGGGGADSFVFDTGTAFTTAIGVDRITDFVAGSDRIVLDKTTFRALSSSAGGTLNPNEFALINEPPNGATLAGASLARIVFNQSNGDLFYNPDRGVSGLGSGGWFATLAGVTSLTASNFAVQA